ncbi:MAG TPA: hypothetical protein DFR83_23450 [Deltaproteobacteria bacterium]|nr:hypothetical protein [Deltaproteobacteria bacterium]
MRIGTRKVALTLVSLCMASSAWARPDDGSGLYTYDPADTLAFWDVPSGDVRVHFSVDGPNATLLADLDEDGVPDFPSLVGYEVAEVLYFFEEAGFRRPIAEGAVGLSEPGGSEALDVYLVDFGGSADGMFGVDRCSDGVCAGHLIIENDFSGYGYPSLEEAAQILASHELFHAVQYAYVDDLDPWFSEGTATWAEHLYRPEVDDYLRFCRAYLADSGRSIDRPPSGMVTAFAYGTALFFGFVQEQYGADRIVVMLETLAAAGDGNEVAAVAEALGEVGVGFDTVWPQFAAWNLATGPRSGGLESYPYADGLHPGIQAEAIAESVVEEHRFYPLAASYFRVQHPGGELLLGLAEDNDEAVHFAVFPTTDTGVVLPALLEWQPSEAKIESLGTQPAGDYWLVGNYPAAADSSAVRLFCFGGPDAMEPCRPEESETDSGEPIGDTAAPEAEASDRRRSAGKGGGCTTLPGHPGSGLFFALLGLMMGARRRA